MPLLALGVHCKLHDEAANILGELESCCFEAQLMGCARAGSQALGLHFLEQVIPLAVMLQLLHCCLLQVYGMGPTAQLLSTLLLLVAGGHQSACPRPCRQVQGFTWRPPPALLASAIGWHVISTQL